MKNVDLLGRREPRQKAVNKPAKISFSSVNTTKSNCPMAIHRFQELR